MKISKFASLLTLTFLIISSPIYSQLKYGAMAIDRNNGYFLGYVTNANTLSEAVKGAISQCNSNGGKCTLVLSFSGKGCVAYRTSAGKFVGMAYGWGIAKNQQVADSLALEECKERTYGMDVPNLITLCNEGNDGSLQIIYNASREIDFMMGIPTDY